MCTADFELQTRSFSDLRLTLKSRTLALSFSLAWKPAGLAGLGWLKHQLQQVQCLFIGIPKHHFLLKKCHLSLEKSKQKLAKLAKKFLS